MSRRLSSNGGFTIVEVAISLVVFTFIMLVFAASLPLAKRAANMNGQYAQAISLCQHKVDQMRAVGYGRLSYDELSRAGIIDETSPVTPPYSFKDVDSDISEYLPQPTATIDVKDGIPDTGCATVIVTIAWKTQSYEAKQSRASLVAVIPND